MRKTKALPVFCFILLSVPLFGFIHQIPPPPIPVEIKKVAYNPNAADYTGLGYEGNPPFTGYIAPLDPAPGLVSEPFVDVNGNGVWDPGEPFTDLNFNGTYDPAVPNFQISDRDFSGACVPGDTIIFYLEVLNESGGPLSVRVEDDVPVGMFNAAVPHVPPPPLPVLPPGTTSSIADTNGNGITGDGGDTVTWNIATLPTGYTLLTYQADVLTDGTIDFGSSIINANASVHLENESVPVVVTAGSIDVLVEAAQLVKEAFQDVACTIPAYFILPGSRLYYRLTVYNTVNAASPIPYTARVTDISDVIPSPGTSPQYNVNPPGLAPQPLVGNTISWQGLNLLGPGSSISGVYSIFIPLGSVGWITNNAQLTYDVAFPPPGATTVTTTSNTIDTRIDVTTFDNLASLFAANTFLVAGDNAYCTDVLGSAKISFGLADGGATNNPEGRTDVILTAAEHDTGNLIPVGGPGINLIADEFDGYFDITWNYFPAADPPVFQILADGYMIELNLNNYPVEDICIVYLAEHNSKNVMLVWGYGWRGTYAGSVYIGDPDKWTLHSGLHMLMLRWTDGNGDGLVQMTEIAVEHSN